MADTSAVMVPKAVVEQAMKCLFAAGALASGYNKPHTAAALRDAYLALQSAFFATAQSDEPGEGDRG